MIWRVEKGDVLGWTTSITGLHANLFSVAISLQKGSQVTPEVKALIL